MNSALHFSSLKTSSNQDWQELHFEFLRKNFNLKRILLCFSRVTYIRILDINKISITKTSILRKINMDFWFWFRWYFLLTLIMQNCNASSHSTKKSYTVRFYLFYPILKSCIFHYCRKWVTNFEKDKFWMRGTTQTSNNRINLTKPNQT